MVEADQLAPEEFVAKLHTCLRLLDLGALSGSIVGSPNQFSSFGTHIPLFLRDKLGNKPQFYLI